MDGRKLYFRPPAGVRRIGAAILIGSAAGSYLGSLAANDIRELVQRAAAARAGESEVAPLPGQV